MARVTFFVAGPPVPAARPRVTKRGTFIPQRQRDYAKQVQLAAKAAGVKSIEGPVWMDLHFYVADGRRRDGDNLQKLVQDALNGIAYADDSQIKGWGGRIDLAKDGRLGPGVMITLEELR